MHCRDERIVGREQLSAGGRGVGHGCNGVGTGHIIIGAPVCEATGMCFCPSACAKHDPPIVAHYGQTGDIESQLQVGPSVPPAFNIFPAVTVVQFIIFFCLSGVIWGVQLSLWYLQRLVR